jgi:iron complex outermembrane receptor protein
VPLLQRLEAVAAARVDRTNLLDGTQFSPRVALVYKPDDGTSIRATYSRAFSSPFGYQYFLDQVANPFQAPGFALRVIGNPSKKGWQFNRSCDSSINGGLCMHSPWIAQGGSASVASSAASAFPGFIAALPSIVNALPTLTAEQKAGLTGLLSQLNPILSTLRPTHAQIGTVLFLNSPIAATEVEDIEPLRASFNDTWELGYKGLIKDRLRVALDLWYQIRGDVGQPLALANPFVLYDPANLGAYLVSSITQGLIAQGRPQAEAEATAAATAAALVPLMAALPQGTLGFTSGLNDDQSFILTYMNGSGKIHVRGVDLGLDYQVRDRWLLSGTYSFQDNTVFAKIGGPANPLMSNTPKHRASSTVRYGHVAGGLGAEATVRYADAFPVNSGYYNSLVPNAYNSAFAPYAPVRAQTQVDLGVSYQLESPRITLGLNASNVLDNRVPTFAGTPAIGRLILGRVRYAF